MARMLRCKVCGSFFDEKGLCPSCEQNQTDVVTSKERTAVPLVNSSTDTTIHISTISSTEVGPGTIIPTTRIPYDWMTSKEITTKEVDFGTNLNLLFHQYHKFLTENTSFDKSKFKEECFKYLDSKKRDYNAHDIFFRAFSKPWDEFCESQRYSEAERVWNFALEITYEWEARNIQYRIHKGTPFYFLAVTYLRTNKIDDAFLLMHKARNEDNLTYGHDAIKKPAHAFITLDPTIEEQYYREKVIEISSFLTEKLEEYNNSKGGHLKFQDFQNRFLKQVNIPTIPQKAHLEEITFFFVYAITKLKKLLNEIDVEYTRNVFGSLLAVNGLFDLCLITDSYIKSKYPVTGQPVKATFGKLLGFLSHFGTHGLSTLLSLTVQRTRDLNSSFITDFDNTLQELLNENYFFSDGTSLNRNSIEWDFAITYGLRNFGGHRIEDQSIIYNQHERLSQHVLNTLFYLVEHAR